MEPINSSFYFPSPHLATPRAHLDDREEETYQCPRTITPPRHSFVCALPAMSTLKKKEKNDAVLGRRFRVIWPLRFLVRSGTALMKHYAEEKSGNRWWRAATWVRAMYRVFMRRGSTFQKLKNVTHCWRVPRYHFTVIERHAILIYFCTDTNELERRFRFLMATLKI